MFSEPGYDVAEMLPIELDRTSTNDSLRYVAFEWIGKRNYLGERIRGMIVGDDERTRGQHFISLDFAWRYRLSDGPSQIVTGEWRYTENYPNGQNKRFSDHGTDRLEIYRPSLDPYGRQIALNSLSKQALFYDPFDQLMRQQLLCSAMAHEHETEPDVVSLLHIASAANYEFTGWVTSSALHSVGSSLHEVWSELVKPGRSTGAYVEDVLPLVCRFAPEPPWATYMERRCGELRWFRIIARGLSLGARPLVVKMGRRLRSREYGSETVRRRPFPLSGSIRYRAAMKNDYSTCRQLYTELALAIRPKCGGI